MSQVSTEPPSADVSTDLQKTRVPSDYNVFSTSVRSEMSRGALVPRSILRLLVVHVVMTVTRQVCRCAGVCGLTSRQSRTVSCVSIIPSVR